MAVAAQEEVLLLEVISSLCDVSIFTDAICFTAHGDFHSQSVSHEQDRTFISKASAQSMLDIVSDSTCVSSAEADDEPLKSDPVLY